MNKMSAFVNMNPETGIRYGVINGNDEQLPECWFDEFQHDCSLCESLKDGDCCNDGECFNDLWYCNSENLKATYNANHNTIMVLSSKEIKECAMCSPCYPNAGDLSTEGPFKTYSFPTH
jgi:hypothetical protein